MIYTNYVEGVQRALWEADYVGYESEKTAAEDAAALGGAMEEHLPEGQGEVAAEGAPPEATKVVAQALQQMAQQAGSDAQVAHAKAEIVQNAISALAEGGAMKTAAVSGNTVAGHNPGRVAKGESSARSTDMKRRLANQVPDDENRKSVFSPMPGKTSLKGPMIGKESAHPMAQGKGGQVRDGKTLANAMDDDQHRTTGYGAPGRTSLKAPMQGAEKKASLADYLARL